MKYYNKPHFIIKKELQKSSITGIYFSDVITKEVLKDVCFKITNEDDFTYEFVDNDFEDEIIQKSYNKGRLAVLFFKDEVSFISFSEKDIAGRNSGIQSVPTAYNTFYNCTCEKKKLYYYFIHETGNAETDYYLLIYRLMMTVGFKFLNLEKLDNKIYPFTSIDDIMYTRKNNSSKNSSNNSTYITKSGYRDFDIYGKTYGANKYETTMFCYAISKLSVNNENITLYEVLEKDLKELPQSCLDVIKQMGKIKVVATDMTLEKKAFVENDSLRSPRYIYNLLDRLGRKKCAFCDCEIPELIQGAHIWPVSNIKKNDLMSQEEKLACATDGNNGLWLCENHHKMFDENLLMINNKGTIIFNSSLNINDLNFVQRITTKYELSEDLMTEQFIKYLSFRNQLI